MVDVEVIRVLRKKSTGRHYVVNCQTSKVLTISRTGAEALCKVFDIEVELFDVIQGRK